MRNFFSDSVFRIPSFPFDVMRQLQCKYMIPHVHDFIEIVLVAQGQAIHTVYPSGGRELSYGLIQGDLFSIMPGEMHSFSESKNLIFCNVYLKEEFLAEEKKELQTLGIWAFLFDTPKHGFRNKIHLSPCRREEAERALIRAAQMCTRREPAYRLRAKAAFIDFLCACGEADEIIEWQSSVNTPDGVFESIQKIEANLSKPFELALLARNASMSVSAYTKKFRLLTGMSPLNYYLNLKLEHVRNQLEKTDFSISELAYRNGFCDGTYLVKLFRQRFGITPARYRKGLILSGLSVKHGAMR